MVKLSRLLVLVPFLLCACVDSPPAVQGEPGERQMSAEIVWDIQVGEPSGLAAMPDGTLLSVGDGDRGLVYEFKIEGDQLSVNPSKMNLREMGHLPHSELPDEQAPDLEGITATRDGRLAVAAEYFGEVWEFDPRLGVVVGLWRFPEIAPDGAIAECLGPAKNHGIEGVAFDPLRGLIVAAQERCPPGLVIFEEKSGRPKRVYLREALDERLGLENPRFAIVTGTLSGVAWAGKAGEFYLLDRLRRHVIRIEVDGAFEVTEKRRWSFAGTFTERGKHAQYGNAEGIAVSGGKLYLVSDPGEGATAQLARFALPK